MDTRYFTIQELSEYCKTYRIKEDITNYSALGVSSIADIIILVEDYKKQHFTISEIKRFIDKLSQLEYKNIIVSDLTQDRLERVLIEEEFWENHCSKQYNPDYLIKLITLMDIDDVWSKTILEEI